MDTDRNLLFGVLALQADLIDPARFAAACTAWAARGDTPLAELLLERGWLTAQGRLRVEDLLQGRLKKGELDSRTDPDLQRGHPTTAEVRPAADPHTEPTLVGTARSGQPAPGPDSTDPSPAQRRRYRLTRIHGSGAIGHVWSAHDPDLGREVALKELRPERQDHPAAQARFLEEACITGQLEHPGIVPVHELAHSEDGRPFYTMRMVRGRTLAEAIKDYHRQSQSRQAGPLELRALLGAFVAVCNAVAYAHSRGVLHRDLKPQNVVLGDFGEVIVLDWGLAKVLRW